MGLDQILLPFSPLQFIPSLPHPYSVPISWFVCLSIQINSLVGAVST